jgi:hypothetical protein
MNSSSPKVANPTIHASDQRRRHLLAPGRQANIAGGASLDTGVVPIAESYLGSGGYTQLGGMINADQPFTVQILQGPTANAQDSSYTLISLQQLPGQYSVLLRFPIGGDWIRIVITNTSGVITTYFDVSIYALPEGEDVTGFYDEYPRFVQGGDATGAAVTDNPFVIAGEDGAGNVRNAQVLAGAVVDPLAVTIPAASGAVLEAYEDDVVSPSTGIMAGGIYQAVKRALEDGDAGHFNVSVFGDQEIAGFNRALGSLQVVEQAPVQYDAPIVTLRADAALAAAGAWDSVVGNIQVPTGGRKFLLVGFQYGRGAAGGSFRHRLRAIITEGGVDRDYQPPIVQAGVFAAGGDVNSNLQREDYLYATGAAADELYFLVYDVGRCSEVYVDAQEVGAVGNPGDLEILGVLHN